MLQIFPMMSYAKIYLNSGNSDTVLEATVVHHANILLWHTLFSRSFSVTTDNSFAIKMISLRNDSLVILSLGKESSLS